MAYEFCFLIKSLLKLTREHATFSRARKCETDLSAESQHWKKLVFVEILEIFQILKMNLPGLCEYSSGNQVDGLPLALRFGCRADF